MYSAKCSAFVHPREIDGAGSLELPPSVVVSFICGSLDTKRKTLLLLIRQSRVIELCDTAEMIAIPPLWTLEFKKINTVAVGQRCEDAFQVPILLPL